MQPSTDHVHFKLIPRLLGLALRHHPMLSSLPGLTENEFRDACQALQKRCDGRLDNTDWLDIQWRDGVLTIRKSYHISSMETLEVDTKTCEADDLAASLGDVDDGDNVRILQVRCKSADLVHQQTLTRYPRSCQKTLVVDFSIILSPTYQVPVLWFTPGQRLLDRPWSLDTVYKHLVPNFQQDQLRQVGVLGGISMAVWTFGAL